MSEKEYIVSLKRGVDASNFKAEMTQSSGDANIPARSVDVADQRILSTRNTHYSLTDEEAEQLKNDSRVALKAQMSTVQVVIILLEIIHTIQMEQVLML